MTKRFLCRVAQACVLLSLAWAGPAQAEKRAALIIGNSAYQNVVRLDNPANDAALVAEMFRKVNFDQVELKLDLGVIEFKRALRDFYNATRDADIAVVYYAGHGIEVGGVNYMIPTDAKLRSDYDAEDEAVALERIFRSIESTRRLRLVILDACRDNPFIRSMQRQIASRAVSQGLAKVEPMGTDTLVAYAAKAGSTADDGNGRNSPFTLALVNNLVTPGLDIRIALGRVRDEVLKRTGNRQEPFVYGSLGGSTISLVPEPEKTVTTIDARGDYELAERVGTISAWESFLALHGTGFYADLARQQRAKLSGALSPSGRPGDSGMAVATLDRSPPPPADGLERATPDRIAWEKVQETTDPAVLRAFIKRFPASPLAVVAQSRLDVLERALAERRREEAERQQAVREAARQREEAAREAARQREEDLKRAKAAEAERQRLERAAAQLREDDERRAKRAELEQQKAEREAARLRAEEERRAKAAEAAREKAAREEAERQTKLAAAEREKAERELARLRDEEDRRAKAAAAAAEKLQREAAVQAETAQREAAAAAEKGQREAALQAEKEHLLQQIKASEPNAPVLVRAAQTELQRLGCYGGAMTGELDAATRRAVEAYHVNARHGAGGEISITSSLVLDMQQQAPIQSCLAVLDTKPDAIERPDRKTPEVVDRPSRERAKPAAVERPQREKKREAAPRREREERRDARSASSRREPARAQAQAYRPAPAPRYGGGGGGSVMHGVGF